MLERQSRLDRALLCSAAYPAAGVGGGDMAARYSEVPRCRPQVPQGAGLPPPTPASTHRARGCRRVGLTVSHLGAVDGVEAAASRRPDGAAAVDLQDSEGRVAGPDAAAPPGASGTLPQTESALKPDGEGAPAPAGEWGSSSPARLPLGSAFPLSPRPTPHPSAAPR